MITYHIIYTNKSNETFSLYKQFKSFKDAEQWCLLKEFIYYEIGIDNKSFKDDFPELYKLGLNAPKNIISVKANKK